VLNWGHGNSFDTFSTIFWAARTVSFIFLWTFLFLLDFFWAQLKNLHAKNYAKHGGLVGGKGQPETKRLLFSLPLKNQTKPLSPENIARLGFVSRTTSN